MKYVTACFIRILVKCVSFKVRV